MKSKKKTWKIGSFSLEKDIWAKIGEISKFEKMSQTELIEYLVRNWEMGINPTEKLIYLTKEREELKEKTNLLDDEIKQATQHLKIFNVWEKQKKNKKGDAVKVLKRFILNRDFEGAERVSKVWQRLTGIPALELLMESSQIIEREGI